METDQHCCFYRVRAGRFFTRVNAVPYWAALHVPVDRFQRLEPSISCGDDVVWVCDPDEGLCLRPVVLVDEALDGVAEFADGAEHAVLESPSRQLGEEAFDGVEPRARGRGEVEGPPRMLLEPCPDRLVLVGGVVVEDGMDRRPGGDRAVDAVEEAHELFVPVTGAELRDHRSPGSGPTVCTHLLWRVLKGGFP